MTPRQSPDVLATAVDGDVLLLDRGRGLIHRLNRTARFVWDRCDGMSGVSDLAVQLVTEFDVDRATAERDVAAVVSQLIAAGVLERPETVGCSGLETGENRAPRP